MPEQPVPSIDDDPRTWYMPYGDVPDMTEAEFQDSDAEEMCQAQFGVGNEAIVVCTRPDAHEGSHVAGDCDRISRHLGRPARVPHRRRACVAACSHAPVSE